MSSERREILILFAVAARDHTRRASLQRPREALRRRFVPFESLRTHPLTSATHWKMRQAGEGAQIFEHDGQRQTPSAYERERRTSALAAF